MLVLSIKEDEKVHVGDGWVQVVELPSSRGRQVRLGFQFDPAIPIHREAIHRQIAANQKSQVEASMRATGTITRETEVECDVALEDVLAELLQRTEQAAEEQWAERAALPAINFIYQLLQKVSDDVVAGWKPGTRALVHQKLAEQVARFAPLDVDPALDFANLYEPPAAAGEERT